MVYEWAWKWISWALPRVMIVYLEIFALLFGLYDPIPGWYFALLWEILSQRHPTIQLIQNSQKLWDNKKKLYCFKLLCFEIICFTAINSSSTFFNLCVSIQLHHCVKMMSYVRIKISLIFIYRRTII